MLVNRKHNHTASFHHSKMKKGFALDFIIGYKNIPVPED